MLSRKLADWQERIVEKDNSKSGLMSLIEGLILGCIVLGFIVLVRGLISVVTSIFRK